MTDAGAHSPASAPQPAPKPRWRVWSIRILLGVLVTALLAWSALNLSHAPVPAPLWSSADLPAVPPPESNGWNDLQQHPGLFRELDTGEIDQAVRSVIEASPEAAVPPSSVLEAGRRQLDAAEVKQAWEICAASLGRPQFVDGCPLDFSQACPSLDILACQRLASFVVLEAAVRGEWAQAAAQSDVLLAQRLGHLRSARSPLGMLIALRAVREELGFSRRLVRWARAARAGAALAPLARRWRGFADDPVDLTSAVVGDYLLARTGAERIAAGEVDSGGGALPSFFFDPGATMAELDRIYSPSKLDAAAAAIPSLPTEPYSARFGWWVRNPLGKLYLEVVLAPRRVFEDLLADRAAVLAERDELLVLLGSP